MLIIDELDEVRPDVGQVVARPLATGICGSDVHALADFSRFASLLTSIGLGSLNPAADCVLGHEFCAEIVDYGPGTEKRLPIGARVCSMPVLVGPTGTEWIGYSNNHPGALAERLILQESLLIPVPDSVGTQLAALTEPMAVGEHAVSVAAAHADQPCMVVGCGPVGLAIIAALKSRGHGPVLAADFSPVRRALAEGFGADVVIDPSESSPHRRWSDYEVPGNLAERTRALLLGQRVRDAVIFEAVGVPGMLESLVADAPPNSHVVVVGACMQPDRFEPFVAMAKELHLQFSFGYSSEEFATTLARLDRGVPGADRLVSAVVGLRDVPDAIDRLNRPGDHGKILVDVASN